MPAPGTVWAGNSWDVNAWAANTWKDAGAAPEVAANLAGAQYMRRARHRRHGMLAFAVIVLVMVLA